MYLYDKKFFKYLYVLGALLFLGYFYWDATLLVLVIAGGISTLMFIVVNPLIFISKSERKWVNVLRFFGIIIATLVILGSYSFFSQPSRCLDLPRYNLYQNIFTGEIMNWNVYCGGGPNPWYLKELRWEDSRNPNPSLNHYIKVLNF